MLLEQSLWVEKYRPTRLQELDHQNDVRAMLETAAVTCELPHLLFYGPAGTGKTSAAIAFAKQVFGQKEWSQHVLELNASDDRGIDVIRGRVKSFSKYMSTGPWKLIVLDECDMMTTDAQNALRRVIEDQSKNTRFILICNYLTKIVDAIASRCAKCRFEALPIPKQLGKLRSIAETEGIRINDDALHRLADVSRGDLRVSINTLQNCSYIAEPNVSITVEDINLMTGSIDHQTVLSVLTKCKTQDFNQLLALAEEVIDNCIPVVELFEALTEVVAMSTDLTDTQKSLIMFSLGSADLRVTKGTSETIQLLALFSSIANVLNN